MSDEEQKQRGAKAIEHDVGCGVFLCVAAICATIVLVVFYGRNQDCPRPASSSTDAP